MKYNLKDLSHKIDAALEKLKEEKPAIKDTGSKNEALRMSSEKLAKLMQAGYTARQIADAIEATAGVRVLPKSIVEITSDIATPKQKIVIDSNEQATNEIHAAA